MKYNLTHLKELESEAIFVIREVAAQFENPALLFSGEKTLSFAMILQKRHFGRAKFLFL